MTRFVRQTDCTVNFILLQTLSDSSLKDKLVNAHLISKTLLTLIGLN